MTGSLHYAWNNHMLSPAIDKKLGLSIFPQAKNMLEKYLSDKAKNPFINFTLIL
jgi:hypothetical protein